MPAPTSIQVIGDVLALAWPDGAEAYLPLEALRRRCPCAACGGEADVLGRVERPHVSYGPESFSIRSWDLVGGYGFQPRWGDGHATGIFSFDYLRRLAAESGMD